MPTSAGLFGKFRDLFDCVTRDDVGLPATIARLEENDADLVGALWLEGKNIDDTVAERIARALRQNTRINELWLNDNKLGDKGAIAFSSLIEVNAAITEMYMAGNGIENLGAASLAAGLTNNTSITYVGLGNNSISDEGGVCLAATLRHNHTITNLDLHSNAIENDDLKEIIKKFLKFNKSNPSREEVVENLIAQNQSDLALKIAAKSESELTDSEKFKLKSVEWDFFQATSEGFENEGAPRNVDVLGKGPVLSSEEPAQSSETEMTGLLEENADSATPSGESEGIRAMEEGTLEK